jgi:hypothetical protein
MCPFRVCETFAKLCVRYVNYEPHVVNTSLKNSENIVRYTGFQTLASLVVKSPISWNIAPCNPVKINRRLGETCHLQLQGRRISQETNQHKAGWFPTAQTGLYKTIELLIYACMRICRLIKECRWQKSDKTQCTTYLVCNLLLVSLPSHYSQHDVSASASAHSDHGQAELNKSTALSLRSLLCIWRWVKIVTHYITLSCSSSTCVLHCNTSYRIFIFPSCEYDK